MSAGSWQDLSLLILCTLMGGGGGLVAKLCLTLCHPMDCTCQAPQSIEFSRQEYWRGLSLHSPEDLPHPGTESRSPELQTDCLQLTHQGSFPNSFFSRNNLDNGRFAPYACT